MVLISFHYNWITKEDKGNLTITLKGPKEMTKQKAPEWFQAFEKKTDKRFDNIEREINSIKVNVNKMMDTPTMKKELNKQK